MKHQPRERIPASVVLTWLQQNYPDLHAAAEVDRNWCWLAVDLRSRPEVRSAIKAYGFRFARRSHVLPSGALGTWAHSCTVPTPFFRGNKHRNNRPARPEAESEAENIMDELAAFAGI